MSNCGCRSKCGCQETVVHYQPCPQPCPQYNISTRNYYGRPVHVNHPHQTCCYSKPNKMHYHQSHCNCSSCNQKDNCKHDAGCCDPYAKQTAVIPTGTVGAHALFAGLDCGTYMIVRSENEEQSVLTVNGIEQESTVGTEIVIGPNTNGSVIMTFEEATASAGFMEIIQTGACQNV